MIDFEALAKRVEEPMKTAQVPAMAMAVAHNDKIIYSKGFGVTSVDDWGIPVTPETLFRIGSTTKPLTGTAVMRLVERGDLDLDTPVSKYVDWLALSVNGAADQITLRHLLSHTTGLGGDGHEHGPRDPEGLEAFVREGLPIAPMIAPPGKLFSYSNFGIDLAGYIAQVVTGKNYADLMAELVFQPLQMRRTTLDPLVAMTYPLAQEHDIDEDGSLAVRHRFGENTAHYPAGFVFSNVSDLANFASMHLNKGAFGGETFLSASSVDEMHKPQADLLNIVGTQYGLTFGVDNYKGIRRVGHGGSVGTFASRLMIAPDHGLAVSMLVNRFTPSFPMEPIINAIFDQMLKLPEQVTPPQAVKPEPKSWPKFTGTYRGKFTGTTSFSVEADRLTLDWLDGKVPLDAIKPNIYMGHSGEEQGIVSVGFVEEGEEPSQFVIVNGTPCERIDPEDVFVADPSGWKAFEGTYTGVDRLTIRLDDAQLKAHFKSTSIELECMPIGDQMFMTKQGLIEFHPADDGSVPMLELGRSYYLHRADS